MFTGIVEEIGTIVSARTRGKGRELTIRAPKAVKAVRIGDSIAVDGCCQTVVRRGAGSFSVVTVDETLRKTTFGNYAAGSRVNIELPMRANGRFDGHLVLGHVDCTTRISAITGTDASRMISFVLPKRFSHLVIPVGSIAVNGVSLTIARLSRTGFSIAIIPHTWTHTTFHTLRKGDRVNIEFDVLGKYVARIASGKRRAG